MNARECGALGDSEAAKACLELAVDSAGIDNWDTRIYRVLSNLFGWEWMGTFSCRLVSLIKSHPGSRTQKQSWMSK